MSNRNTQFSGFAKLLRDDICNVQDGMFDVSDWWKEQVQKLIARRAYDLVAHIVGFVCPIAFLCCKDTDDILHDIPDMTEWPEEQE